MAESTDHPVARGLLALLFIAAGIAHFRKPRFYERMMPTYLPRHRELVLWSGVAEIAGGLGLLIPRLRRTAGRGLVALLWAVFPANLEMLRQAYERGSSPGWRTALWLRLPLQGWLARWVRRAAR